MGVCIFVASGLSFDVDRYLKSSPLKAASVFRKGQIPPKDNPEQQPRPDSGFAVLLSQDEEPGLDRQIKDALAFIFNHEQELERLKECSVDNMVLDFGVEVGGDLQQSQYLPPELIVALGAWKMGLVFSVVQFPRG